MRNIQQLQYKFRQQYPNYQSMKTQQLQKAVEQFSQRERLMFTQRYDLQSRMLSKMTISPITQKGKNQQTGGKNQQLSPLQNQNFFHFEGNKDNEDHGYKEKKQIQKKQIQTPTNINIANDGIDLDQIDPGRIDLDPINPYNQSVRGLNKEIQGKMQNRF